MKSTISRNGDYAYAAVVVDGELYNADSEHPNWSQIIEAIEAGDEGVVDLFDIQKAVTKMFDKVSERVSVKDGVVYFDSEAVHNTLTDHIVKVLNAGGNAAPLVNFFEKVQTNPNEHSRKMLFDWLSADDFTIAGNGDIVGYKGVNSDGDGGFLSISSGTAIRNGEEITGRIPNAPGDVIEMPRSVVQHDPSVGCHTGLHVGTWGYASTFGSITLEVHVNPRDVVSVPTDCSAQKMRTCRYTVVDVVEKRYDEPVLADGEVDDIGYDTDEEDVEGGQHSFKPNSSWIDGVYWEEGVLTVDTKDRTYEYEAPFSVYENFKSADSAGRFFNEHKDSWAPIF